MVLLTRFGAKWGKILDAKLDSLYEHVGRKKAKVDTPRMVEGNIYYYPKYVANLHNNVTY